ncbi:MAG: ubiquitin-conjugating enzyme E2 variant, partial [Candidatus Hodarchaeota archaeon]
MNKQRILREAQQIAKKFSFWMVSGDISHLYGYIYETAGKKYEIEIKFDEEFPKTPPKIIYHSEIKETLGSFQPKSLINWTPESNVLDIVLELNNAIKN